MQRKQPVLGTEEAGPASTKGKLHGRRWDARPRSPSEQPAQVGGGVVW
jgi:hypothetical protein